MSAFERSTRTKVSAVGSSHSKTGNSAERMRVKAPFLFTTMSDCAKRPLYWLWSRRGRNWAIDQELSFYLPSDLPPKSP
jgi:hypothetical protein